MKYGKYKQDLDQKRINGSKNFYDDRYDKGYMEWKPKDIKLRIFEIVKSLNLPDEGEALDFGCGNGVFTRILKQALPDWKIYGCDLSEIAISNANAKIKDCKFMLIDDLMNMNEKFDFVFSHHVLEHIFNIEEVARQIAERTKDGATMLHILPCGNPGSFEWRLCDLREDGIDKKMGNRFYFEDIAHVRRMTTESCALLFDKVGFTLILSLYSDQNYGAQNWITRSHPGLIFKMFNPLKGKNLKSKLYLLFLLVKYSLVSALRLPYVAYERFNYTALKLLLFIPSRLSIFVDRYIIYKSEQEWRKLKTEKNGGEMYLCFKKGG